jgi:hypothetical protein
MISRWASLLRGALCALLSAVTVGLCLGYGSFRIPISDVQSSIENFWPGFGYLCALWFGWWGLAGAATAAVIHYCWARAGWFGIGVVPGLFLSGGLCFFYLLDEWKIDLTESQSRWMIFVAAGVANAVRAVVVATVFHGSAGLVYAVGLDLLLNSAVTAVLAGTLTGPLWDRGILADTVSAWMPRRVAAWKLGEEDESPQWPY